jgi:hypothetical protein
LGVNFFGHAVVASWTGPSAGLALGAMLPDFQAMSGARVADPGDAEVAAGIELHHRTDAAFHRLPGFVALGREVEARLEAAGVARGPRRAVGHIGVELLLDGVLLADGPGRAAYLAALDHPVHAITWRDEGDGARFAMLHARLRDHGVPDDLARPEAAAARVLRAIAHRPLLRASPSEADAIRAELVRTAPRVRVAAPAIMSALRAGLQAPGSTGT